jgi:hypothetical protein
VTQDANHGTIDAILRTIYETISGPAGPRDWAKERTLFAAGAILVPPATPPVDLGSAAHSPRRIPNVMDLEEWIASRSPFFESTDFFEEEVARRTFHFGNVAHVFSVYEARRRSGDPEVLWRGINSVQLSHDGERWWIVSIAWDNERLGNPLPEWARAGTSPAPTASPAEPRL